MLSGGHAEPPARGAQEEAGAGEREDRQQPPADAADAVDDLADAGAADGVGEEHQATERRQHGQNVATADGHGPAIQKAEFETRTEANTVASPLRCITRVSWADGLRSA